MRPAQTATLPVAMVASPSGCERGSHPEKTQPELFYHLPLYCEVFKFRLCGCAERTQSETHDRIVVQLIIFFLFPPFRVIS